LTSPGTGADRQGDAFTLGTSFDVLTVGNIVTALGIYDEGGQFVSNHQIALWDHTAGDTVVASATFLASSTNSGTPAGFLYIAVSPVTLIAGHNYVLGAFYPGTFAVASGDHLLDHSSTPGTDPNFGNFVARFDTSNAGFQEPLGGTSGSAYVGPNLQFTPAPEPSTLLSLGIGLAGLAWVARRRRQPLSRFGRDQGAATMRLNVLH
jgi:hypothetical protein